MDKIIEVHQLKKSFGSVQAVNDISFQVQRGSLFSFLGTNGAGKSTVISMILTLLTPDSGTVRVNGFTAGKEDEAIRKEIGVVFQNSVLDTRLSVEENLDVRAGLYGMNKQERQAAIARCAEITEIGDILKRRYGKLSGGQKRRADIARALLHEPAVLILDEPTTGLDPKSRRNVWRTIAQLQKEQGMTVFLTTHYIEEAADSDYVTVIKDGRVIAKGTPGELKDRYSADRIWMAATDADQLRMHLQTEGILFREENGHFTVELSSTRDAIPLLAGCQTMIASFEVRKSSLDDVFIRIHEGKDGERRAAVY